MGAPPIQPSCRTSPENQHREGSVGLVTCVAAQLIAPEVMMPQVPEGRFCSEVLREHTRRGIRAPPSPWAEVLSSPSLPPVLGQATVILTQDPDGPPRGCAAPSACSPVIPPRCKSCHPTHPPLPGPSRLPDTDASVWCPGSC